MVKAQVVSKMSYRAQVWLGSLNYNLIGKIRSVYLIIRTVLTDFKQSFIERKGVGLQIKNAILYKRTTVFLFNTIHLLAPTTLAIRVILKFNFNERYPLGPTFFDTSCSRLIRICITNIINNYSKQWEFDGWTLVLTNFNESSGCFVNW